MSSYAVNLGQAGTQIGRWFFATCFIFVVGVSVASGANEDGESIFRKQCSQCHDLPDTKKLTAEGWVKRLNLMAPMAGLNKKQKAKVLSFLQSHSKQATKVVSLADDKRLFEEKCTLCHNTNRILLEPLTPKSRRHIVLRMQQRAPAGWITAAEGNRILKFLEKGAPGVKKPVRKAINGGAKVIFQKRCSTCHSLERVYLKLGKSKGKDKGKAWMHIVDRMQKKSPQWIDKAEAKQILKYLSGIQAGEKH